MTSLFRSSCPFAKVSASLPTVLSYVGDRYNRLPYYQLIRYYSILGVSPSDFLCYGRHGLPLLCFSTV